QHKLSIRVLQPPQLCTDFQSASLLRGSSLKVQFLLFSSSNPSCGQLLSTREDLQNSTFNATLGTKVIIHGFRVLGTKPSWTDGLIKALLQAAQANVIAVDWVHGSTAAYYAAVENVMKLALEIASFIRKLLDLGVPEKSIHLIGVSLGAHAGGLVGHFFEGRLGRITGLDPAGPKYTKASREERLDPGDAVFVEAIHTDADSTLLALAKPMRLPKPFVCPSFCSVGSYNYLICDHMRSVQFYTSALTDPCPMMAFPCTSYKDFLTGHCLDCFPPFPLSCPTIGLLDNGGVHVGKLSTEVKVYLTTAASAPYCVYHSLVEFRLQTRRTSDTNIEIAFLSSNSSFSTSIIIPKQQTAGKGLLTHSAPLCQVKSVMLQHRHKTWRRNKEETPVWGQFCTAPLPVDTSKEIFCLPQLLTLTRNNPLLHDLTVACD
uniref:Phospholipase A1 member A n=1 Tax=Podarcis muralis TaxID=64176 RepID=A0A670JNU2_PODMU